VKGQLESSGIAGTLCRYPFNYDMACWLSAKYGRAVTIDWTSFKRRAWDEVAGLLSLVVAPAESEGLDAEVSVLHLGVAGQLLGRCLGRDLARLRPAADGLERHRRRGHEELGDVRAALGAADGLGDRLGVAVDEASVPHLVYSAPEGLRYMTWGNGTWVRHAISADGPVAGCAIATEGRGTVHIAVADGRRGLLRYATNLPSEGAR